MSTNAESTESKKGRKDAESIKVNWAELKYSVQARWPALTEQDLNLAEGTYEELYDRIAARTGESVGDIETAVREIPGFEQQADWTEIQANLRKKYPTLTQADLGTSYQPILVSRIANRTWETVEDIEKAIAAATPPPPPTKEKRPAAKTQEKAAAHTPEKR